MNLIRRAEDRKPLKPLDPRRLDLFVTCPRGIEDIVEEEISEIIDLYHLPAPKHLETGLSGVDVKGASTDLAVGLILGLSTASRVLWQVGLFQVSSPEELKDATRQIPWPQIFGVNTTFVVQGVATAQWLHNGHLLSLMVKDAVVDVFRSEFGIRPSVDVQNPKVSVYVYLKDELLSVCIDLVGSSLHLRHGGDRLSEAPMRENLAAALLRLAGWHHVSAQIWNEAPLPVLYNRVSAHEIEAQARRDFLAQQEKQSGEDVLDCENDVKLAAKKRRIPEKILLSPIFLDPMMGSGTLLFEAAYLLIQRKPALKRKEFAFQFLCGHEVFQASLERMLRRIHGTEKSPTDVPKAIEKYFRITGLDLSNLPLYPIQGADSMQVAVSSVEDRLHREGLQHMVKVEHRPFDKVIPHYSHGISVINPPYGERLMESENVEELYKEIGNTWKKQYKNWVVWMISSNQTALKKVGLRPTRNFSVFNGNLPCKFSQFIIY